MKIYLCTLISLAATFLLGTAGPSSADALERNAKLELNKGDHIAFIGNNLAERMQHHGWLETYLHAAYPDHQLTFRNLGFTGDEVNLRPRSENFGPPDQWLTKTEADVVFCFFGYNEALRGKAALPAFQQNLANMIEQMLKQKYNGSSTPRLVLFSPIAHENLNSPHLPDGTANNVNLAAYTDAMAEVCEVNGIPFVDLFAPTNKLYATSDKPLTMNGVHLLEHGNKLLADVIVRSLLGDDKFAAGRDAELKKLRQAVLDKNYHWFSRYRVVDGYNVFGGRSTLAWHGQSNADVMRREMEIFDVMTGNRDQRVWAVAQGREPKVVDDNLPPLLEVKTNKRGPLQEGRFPYLGGKEAIDKMKVAEGMEINLFASEAMFPRLINPVQMAVDGDSRLWASVWPSYPHWNPTEPRKDALVILPDEDGDGVADECIVFADELNSITGFEFWGGGVLVASPPEIWFLKDTDGDDRADTKLRVLQGLSSADSHHSANAMVIGPDGWLYWSRGIFNIANMETPTRTYRSDQTGVHRFNPRTFEVEFHFPIGPNPHGDAFDGWGYQFANDGTSGTGSYINIGKGRGNKQWFNKRVRPVSANGFLSSSHFPDANNGNFLISNVIGFLGVLQHEIKYNGADITAKEIEPIVVSSDPNFRPSDMEIGGDGALYIADWQNTLIGHMQHNMRDPNRDHTHGRVYRVTCKGRPLLKPAKMKGQPIAQVCENFFAQENGTRYRARLELSGRDTQQVVAQVGAFAAGLDPRQAPRQRDQAQALLECLWVFEEHRVPNLELLQKVYQAEEPRVRAAAIRTLGHWADRISGWESILLAAARDNSALVRAEVVKAAVEFDGVAPAEAVFEVASLPTDPELDTVLNYARQRINVDQIIQDAIKSGTKLSPSAQAYALRNASIDDLLRMEKTEAVFHAILRRTNVDLQHLRTAVDGLAEIAKADRPTLLLEMIEEADARQRDGVVNLGAMLLEQPAEKLSAVRDRLQQLAATATAEATRRLAYALWIGADRSADDAFVAAARSKDSLSDFLEAMPQIADPKLRAQMFAKIRPLLFELPASLKSEQGSSSVEHGGIRVDFFEANPDNAAIETFAELEPTASGIVPAIQVDVPLLTRRDQFALRFTGVIQIDQPGDYTFFTVSDDGSRLYIGNELVVNNDGKHGMVEKQGNIQLVAGSHPIVVTYFDDGGGDGLDVYWSGPELNKQKIPEHKLGVSGAETLHDVAIRVLEAIPGHEADKFQDLASLVKAGRHRTSAIRALRSIPSQHSAQNELRPLADNLVAYLSEMPARYRTGPSATDAMDLARQIAEQLPEEQGKTLRARLENLDVRVIAIGTVPHRMIYDKEQIAVQAGKPVEFRFSNSDEMPHNFAIVMPGALEEVGLLAEATALDADAAARHFIPKSDKILLASRLLQPGQNQALTFDAPQEPGVYPYVCTYPGHWRRMYGTLYVVNNLAAFEADAESYLANNPLPIKDELLKYSSRGREWTFDQLVESVRPLSEGRNFEIGQQVFKVANCIACHRLNDEGYQFGPDLAKLDPQKKPEDLLRSIVEPSHTIEEKYQTNVFELDSGKVVTGMVLKEDKQTVEVIEDPLAKARPRVLQVDEIELREKGEKSMMPEGLLDKLGREEIIDLLAYIYAGGDKKNKIFGQHHHH